MYPFDNLKLDHQLCFALYAATNAITRSYRGRLKQVGLTYPQYLVMMVLWEEEGLSLKEISQRLQLDPATLSPLIQRLCEADLIEKRRGAVDDRTVNIYLKEGGREIQPAVAEMQKSVACKTGLSSEQFEELRASLHSLVETLNADEPESDKDAA